MKIAIRPASPFDFHLSASIFAGGDPQIQRYQDGRLWQLIRSGGKLMLAVINSRGTVDSPLLQAELHSDGPLQESDLPSARARVEGLLNMGLDLLPFYQVAERDPVMSGLVSQMRGLHSPTTPTVYEALITSIVEQQISIRVARNLQMRLVRAFGRTLTLDGKTYYAFPEPRDLAAARPEDLRGCGLSLRKGEYIIGVSREIARGRLDLESLAALDDREVIARLSRMRGIGVWTAELTMVRGMRRFDSIPADDLGVRRCISRYYRQGAGITGAEAREIASRWKPWRGLASFYLITAEQMGLAVQE
ncbi:MAG: DNA-3-methyladenine glycosylase 2 family protein [Methanosarcinales archaeon]|nr:DNA-3-methyladenine glycosylase 2 family protein [Methanosarcinales archaeon]